MGYPADCSGSCTMPAGFHADIQVKVPGSTTWKNWLTNQTTTSGTYHVKKVGTYSFRARYVADGPPVVPSAYTPAAKCKSQ